jgi:hypothetical protein
MQMHRPKGFRCDKKVTKREGQETLIDHRGTRGPLVYPLHPRINLGPELYQEDHCWEGDVRQQLPNRKPASKGRGSFHRSARTGRG